MMKMDQEVIYRAVRGEASPEELNRVARWHQENPDEFQRLSDEVHWQIDMMELHGETFRPSGWLAIHWKRTVRIALQAAAVLAVGLFIGGYIGTEHTYDLFAEQANTLNVPYGQRIQLVLPDGSSVQLNSGATLEYPAVFRKDMRRVKLSGEALFEVEHDKGKPFIVETFASDIRVLGTKFNVEADAKRNRFSTALFEGRVQISNRLNPTEEDVVLEPNDMVCLSNGRLQVEAIDDPELLCWTEGLISISNRPFDELMEAFERTFDVHIVIARDSLPNIRNVSGKIRVNDGIDKALHILQYTADFLYKIDPENNIVTIY